MVVSPKATFAVARNRLVVISALAVTLPCLISVSPAFSQAKKSLSNSLKSSKNHNFTFIIQPQFTSVSEFSEGLAPVYIGYREGYVDRTGKVIIPALFDGAGEFSEGLAWVNISGKWGYINKKRSFSH
ncbi:MAG: WG repeat-containing protein [Nostocaceae cyanobacterium CSU_2_110]|nr:WG repeat-containing protein [Nostocaceae cyanobacterium CSU_2_110]